ncbi:hypothetical protein [Nocardia aurantia]|uniref:hypothetical protein n=1 Tax=Nocardia aurantia TaxID=2585199 RepID=UPI0012961B96|nr:hypothetical protein [Nocardia aurantia]
MGSTILEPNHRPVQNFPGDLEHDANFCVSAVTGPHGDATTGRARRTAVVPIAGSVFPNFELGSRKTGRIFDPFSHKPLWPHPDPSFGDVVRGACDESVDEPHEAVERLSTDAESDDHFEFRVPGDRPLLGPSRAIAHHSGIAGPLRPDIPGGQIRRLTTASATRPIGRSGRTSDIPQELVFRASRPVGAARPSGQLRATGCGDPSPRGGHRAFEGALDDAGRGRCKTAQYRI